MAKRKVLLWFVLILLLIIVVGCAVAYMQNGKQEQPSGDTNAEATVGTGMTAAAVAVAPAGGHNGWLEMPGVSRAAAFKGTTTSSLGDLQCFTHTAPMGGREQRNYTLLYDPEVCAAYWVAYPICADHLGTGREEFWGYDPAIPTSKQTKVSSGAYKVNVGSPNSEGYDGSRNYYARGHQIPNADRNGVPEMMAQTYYSTNMTPQIQKGMNSGIWSSLEAAVRSCVPVNDTLYVVTGAAFRKAGGNEEIHYITSARDGKTLPLPNYYWKVILKVKRSGAGISDAKAIGFWIDHSDHGSRKSLGADYRDYDSFTVSVDQIETWTGFDFFVNLPDSIENTAEANTSWEAFQRY